MSVDKTEALLRAGDLEIGIDMEGWVLPRLGFVQPVVLKEKSIAMALNKMAQEL